MASNKDYIPRADVEFETWVGNFVDALDILREQLGFPAGRYAELVALRDDFAQKIKLAREPATRTIVTVGEKNRARNALKKAVRQAVKEFLQFNSNMTDGNRDDLGLPIHKTTHRHAPVADYAPHFSLDTPLLGHVRVHFSAGDGSRRQAKPPGQHSAEIAWVISDVPPVDMEELLHSATATHSPHTFEFDYTLRGKTLYVALRWENTRGEKGPWSDIKNAIIP